jgi:hypothetical protein
MQPFYNPKNDTFTYIKDGKKTVYSLDEMEFYFKLEEEWKENHLSKVPTTIYELASTYPEAREYLEKKVAQQDKEIVKLNELLKKIKANPLYKKQENKQLRALLIFSTTRDRNRLVQQVEWNESIIDAIKAKGRKKVPKGALTESEILQAKSIPVTNFIQFGRDNKACCIWHNEKTGSMHYYKKTNKVHCFGCNQGGDVVDVIQQMHGIDFRDAVRFLINK